MQPPRWLKELGKHFAQGIMAGRGHDVMTTIRTPSILSFDMETITSLGNQMSIRQTDQDLWKKIASQGPHHLTIVEGSNL